MARVDHLVVSAATLDEGADWIAQRLGVLVRTGGKHALMGTYNRLLSLGPQTYLEVIAIDPDAPDPGRARWFGLDGFSGPPRLTHWVMRVPDLAAALRAAPSDAGAATDLARGPFRWRFAVTASGHQPFDDVYPALIEWQGTAHPATGLADRGCRLLRLVCTTPDPAALGAVLPCDDTRVTCAAGAPGLAALIATPQGERWL